MLLATAILFMMAACANEGTTPERATTDPNATCHEQSQDYITATEALMEDWDGALAHVGVVFTSEGIEQLVPSLNELHQLRKELAAIAPPICATYIHAYHLAYVDQSIEMWMGIMDGDRQVVSNYKNKELVELFRLFETGFVSLQHGTDLALYPTPTPRPIVAGADDSVITLPTTLTITSTNDDTDIEVRDDAGGNIISCRLEVGSEVTVVESSWDRAYLRVERTSCDGWVVSSKVMP